MTRTSHAVVIGAGLGGLAAAMRLGAKGYRVTVLDRLDRAGGRGSSITQDGHRFDLGPTIVTVPKLLEELWRACGRDFRADVDLRALDPFYEIRWPEGSRFTANGDTHHMIKEVRRLSPDDVPGYLRFLKDSETRYHFGFETLGRRPMNALMEIVKVLPTFARLRADRSMHGLVAARVKDPRLRMALSFHPLFIGGDPFRVTSIYALVSHLEKEFGVHYAIGGVQAIADAMVRVIEGQGGEVRLGAEVEEITTDAQKANGVRLADGERLTSDIVVSNADAGHTYARLLTKPKRRWTATKLAGRRWSMGLFVWYFGTAGTKMKWPDVGHHTILNGPRYKGLIDDIFIKGRLADDMSLYVHRPSVTDPTVAPPGDDTFYALSPVPHLAAEHPVSWLHEADRYKAKVAKVLDGLIPGFQDHIRTDLTFTPDTFRDRYLSMNGSGFSIEPRILQSAWFRPHSVSEEVEGLYLVGAGTHPGAGVPGVIASAEVLSKIIPDAAHPLAVAMPQQMAAE